MVSLGTAGATAFIHQFGSSLNAHVHCHVWAVNGVFEVVAGDEKPKPSNCNWTARNLPFVVVGLRCFAGPHLAPGDSLNRRRQTS